MEDKISPLRIKPGTRFKAISAKSNHSFAIDEYGALWAWGQNSYGQLGNGTITNSAVPIKINF